MTRKLIVIASLLLAVSAFAADDIMKWNRTPEAYYMTSAERAEWKNVSSPEQAQKFVDEYFRKRGEQFRKDVRTRIDKADELFKLDKTPGSRTQRGRVWMILGNPSRSRTSRDTTQINPNASPSAPITRDIDRQGLVVTEWTYDADRLPPELGRKSLTIRFQTDSFRGLETIENVGNVEPILTQAATIVSNDYTRAAQAQLAQRSALPTEGSAPATAGTPDPLWNATPSLNGAIFTGDSFVGPTEQTFYAYNFYIPANATAVGDWKSGLLVTLVRDANGQQVASRRDPVDLGAYDSASGARYVDRSVVLPPGRYEGFFALYSPDGTTLLSSHRTSFEVAPKEAPRASALFLTSRIDTLENQAADDPFTFVATKYAVRGDRRFRVTDKLAFFTVIANPVGSPNPNLMQKMLFKRDGKEFARTPLEPVQLTQTGPNTFLVGNAFEAETFPAGHYTLELQVRDMNAPDGDPMKTRGYVLSTEFDVVK